MDEWINIEDEQPEDDTPVLITGLCDDGKTRYTDIAYWNEGGEEFCVDDEDDKTSYWIYYNVTHWQPLPETDGLDDEGEEE